MPQGPCMGSALLCTKKQQHVSDRGGPSACCWFISTALLMRPTTAGSRHNPGMSHLHIARLACQCALRSAACGAECKPTADKQQHSNAPTYKHQANAGNLLMPTLTFMAAAPLFGSMETLSPNLLAVVTTQLHMQRRKPTTPLYKESCRMHSFHCCQHSNSHQTGNALLFTA